MISWLVKQVENNDFINAAYYYNEDVLYGSELLRLCPNFLRPWVPLHCSNQPGLKSISWHPTRVIGMLIPMFLSRQRVFFYGLVDIIENRMRNSNRGEKFVSHAERVHKRGIFFWHKSSTQNDVIQWIIDTSPKSKPWSPERMAFEVMAIWFGSVQGLATVSISSHVSR